jgi:hypothetical protein
VTLELCPEVDSEGLDRIFEFTGWSTDDDTSCVGVGAAVNQQLLGMGATQLDVLRRAIDLVPKQLLGIDAYVAASFEWLSADKAEPGLGANWWANNEALCKGATKRFPSAEEHLSARVPPNGTEPWAAVPFGTLALALEVISDGDDAALAIRGLLDAVTFAPRLVTRDLVLSLVLLRAPRTANQDAPLEAMT